MMGQRMRVGLYRDGVWLRMTWHRQITREVANLLLVRIWPAQYILVDLR